MNTKAQPTTVKDVSAPDKGKAAGYTPPKTEQVPHGKTPDGTAKEISPKPAQAK
jgi:hypothetical protein